MSEVLQVSTNTLTGAMSQNAPTIATPILTADTAIEYLVKAGGNINLAAERIGRDFKLRGFSKHDLVATIASDPAVQSDVALKLRTLVLLNLFETFQLVQIALVSNLEALEPKEAAKTLTNIANIINLMTQSGMSLNTNINVTEVVLRMLPPTARDALLSLVEPTK